MRIFFARYIFLGGKFTKFMDVLMGQRGSLGHLGHIVSVSGCSLGTSMTMEAGSALQLRESWVSMICTIIMVTDLNFCRAGILTEFFAARGLLSFV